VVYNPAMRRRLFNILAALSLVVCVGLLVMAVRSAMGTDKFARWRARGVTSIVFEMDSVEFRGGSVSCFRQRLPDRDHGSWQWTHWRSSFAENTWQTWLSFGMQRSSRPYSMLLFVRIPLWLPITLTAIPPTMMLTRLRRRRKRRKVGHCLACGYNLTGNVSGICPECGTAIPVRPSAEGATA